MAESFIGEIRLFAGSYAPQDWAICDGRLLAIKEYQALFSLIGTIYGGDGVKTFALPNLQGSVAIGHGQSPDTPGFNPPLGSIGGSEIVTVTPSQMPRHNHAMQATAVAATTADPGPSVGFASVAAQNLLAYTDLSGGQKPGATPTALGSNAVSTAGNSSAHSNMMRSMPLTYIIALFGEYPMSS